MENIYFHIGLHKTGTTYLQTKYFPKLPVNYIKGSQPYFKVLDLISGNKEKVLISEENFSGQLFSGNKNQQFINTVLSIKDSYPNAKIIIGFRKHSDFIMSAYKQALHEGKTLSFDQFYNDKDTGMLKKRDINFKHSIDFISQKFKDVFIYTIDDVKDMETFNIVFARFLNIKPPKIDMDKGKVNKSIQSNFQVNTILNLNKLDAFFKRTIGLKILYSKLFKFLEITPRKICQNYLPGSGKKYVLDARVLANIDQEFHDDWNYVLSQKFINE